MVAIAVVGTILIAAAIEYLRVAARGKSDASAARNADSAETRARIN